MLPSLHRRKGDDKDGRIDDEPDGPTASHAAALISALFLLIFAIAVIVPWTVADSARQNTYAETQAIIEAYWAAGGLPAAESDATRTALKDYVAFTTSGEWDRLADGELHPDGWRRLDALRARLDGLDLKERDQRESLASVGEQIETVYSARRQRAVDANAALPFGLLLLVAVTAVLVLLFPLLSGARPKGLIWLPYLLMAAGLAVSVYLAFAINHTFTGPLGVGPEAFESAQDELARIP